MMDSGWLWLALVLVMGLLIYLLAALLRPENFS